MKITNWPPNYEMKSINVLHRFYSLAILLIVATTSIGQETAQLDTAWYRRNDSIFLNSDHTFLNSDKKFLKLKEGTWKRLYTTSLVFTPSENDTVATADTIILESYPYSQSGVDFSKDKKEGYWKFGDGNSILYFSSKNDTLGNKQSFKYISRTANNEGNFLNIENGTWTPIKKRHVVFSPKVGDTTHVADTVLLTKLAGHRLSFQQGKQTFTFQLADYVKPPGFSLYSLSRGLLGVFVLILIGYIFSTDRKSINWKLVGKGLLLQLTLALLILKVPFVETIFEAVATGFRELIDFSHEGATFLFGGPEGMPPMLKNFAFYILPSVVFFSALTSLLYYFGILQKIVKVMAWVMKKLLGLSGSESVAAAGNVFIGQTEAPLLVKPYLARMTKSELMCLMVGGMATIAGGVLAAVIGILGEGDAVKEVFYAKHLLTASLMSAPAAIVFAKMLVPEKEKFSTDLSVSQEKIGVNALEAITNGTTDGLKLAVNVGAMLLVFVSLIALANAMLGWFGGFTGLNEVIASGGYFDQLSFEAISGYVFSPLAWLMGVEWYDAVYVGQLLGEKTILNEFIAYPHMGEIQDEMSFKSVLMSTYVLCGFANIASIGIQVGGIGILVPQRKSQLAKFGVRALIGGTLACMMTAVLVGVLY